MAKKILSNEELFDLLYRWQVHKDQEAITKIIKSNMGLVKKIAVNYLNYNLTYEELEAIGMEKTWQVANSFNYEDKGEYIGKVFSTYLGKAIERGILREISVRNKYRQELSFSQPIGQSKDGKVQTIEDTLGTDEDMLINEVILEIKSNIVLDALKTLTTKERNIILLRYGLDEKHAKTLEELGKIYGISRETVRLCEEKALVKMRHPRNTRKLKDFIEE